MKRELSAKKKAEAWAKFRAQEPHEAWTPDPPVYPDLTPEEKHLEDLQQSCRNIQRWQVDLKKQIVDAKVLIKTSKTSLELAVIYERVVTEEIDKLFQENVKKSQSKKRSKS